MIICNRLVRLTEEKAAKAYLKEVIKAIGFLNKKGQKETYERGLAVLSEITALKKYSSRVPMREARDLARLELIAGVQRYLIGFYEDSIYHATLSVEMSLLIKLDEELSPEEKTDIHLRINLKNAQPYSFTFGNIPSVCREKERKIMNNRIDELVGKIIETRNTHIHASNLTSASILSMQELTIPEIDKGIKDIETIEENPIVSIMMKKWLPQMKKILVESRSTINSLPCFEWCTRDKQRAKTRVSLNQFFKEQFTSINTIRSKQQLADKLRTGLHSKDIIRGYSQDNYSTRKALETIHDSFEVLKAMGFFDD